ncbi:hypothetical protein, partial [uncultured Prevotella sp.]|uniref:hypothetical protein n=1 Tax=uncultured Prevotella sp. TaxID=159272 RepID=UPI002804A169
LWKDTTQQLLGLHDAKITNTYEIMCMRGEGLQLGFTTDPKQVSITTPYIEGFNDVAQQFGDADFRKS